MLCFGFFALSKEEIFPFIKITHNSRYSFKYTWFFIEFIRCLLEYEDKGQALQQAEQRCDVEVNRQNLCNGSFVVDTVESVVNWFMAGNSYKECVFSAINSGKSSDAVGALTGLLAGIYYGLELKNGVKGFETMESYIDLFIQYLNHPTSLNSNESCSHCFFISSFSSFGLDTDSPIRRMGWLS